MNHTWFFWFLFAPDAAEVGRAVLVAGRTGAGCGHPGPLPLPLQLRLWMWYKVRLGPPLQISKRYPANLLPLRCCQRQHQCASVPHHSLWTHNATTGNGSDSPLLVRQLQSEMQYVFLKKCPVFLSLCAFLLLINIIETFAFKYTICPTQKKQMILNLQC